MKKSAIQIFTILLIFVTMLTACGPSSNSYLNYDSADMERFVSNCDEASFLQWVQLHYQIDEIYDSDEIESYAYDNDVLRDWYFEDLKQTSELDSRINSIDDIHCYYNIDEIYDLDEIRDYVVGCGWLDTWYEECSR